jgi:hypothetical protein
VKQWRSANAVVLAGAIGAPVAGFAGEMKEQQPVTPTPMQVPFLHELAGGATANETVLASLERADAWLNSPPLTPQALRGNGGKTFTGVLHPPFPERVRQRQRYWLGASIANLSNGIFPPTPKEHSACLSR